MYKQYLSVKPGKNGLGLFTSIEIPADVPIAEANGPIHFDRDLVDVGAPNLLQIGPDVQMGLSGHLLPDYINHSCNPNCKFHIVGNRAILYSMYVISGNTELTFDYSTTDTSDHNRWKMDCTCGFHKCRKVISGFQYLDPVLQEEYKAKGMVPLYITNPNMILKR